MNAKSTILVSSFLILLSAVILRAAPASQPSTQPSIESLKKQLAVANGKLADANAEIARLKAQVQLLLRKQGAKETAKKKDVGAKDEVAIGMTEADFIAYCEKHDIGRRIASESKSGKTYHEFFGVSEDGGYITVVFEKGAISEIDNP